MTPKREVVTVPKDYLEEIERRLAIAEWFIYTYDDSQKGRSDRVR